LGLGLPGAKRLVSEFEVQSVVGRGTRVVVVRWQ
jgi:serine/threonine-protein kinase RsbT